MIGLFFSIIMFLIIIIMPSWITVRNVILTFCENEKKIQAYEKVKESWIFKKINGMSEKKTERLTVILGTFLCFLFIVMLGSFYSSADWDKAIYYGQKHTFLHSEYGQTVAVVFLFGFIGMLVLTFVKPEKLPPLPEAFCFAFSVIAEAVLFVLSIQLMAGISIAVFPIWVFLFNLVMMNIRMTKRYIKVHLQYKQEHDVTYRFDFAKRIEEKLNSYSSMSNFRLFMFFPAAVILLAVFILIGQGPDGLIKAFTMTADWTFSKQTPPPPIDYHGHYLCTVAAGGHKKVVKPLRYGIRCGDTIVVNRQLLASNAFEDLIMERTPKFHKAVRGFYNKYGYPISKFIKTQTLADIVYILMKPLEWIFVITLYTFDVHPENRIAVQYSGYKKGISKNTF